jgi:Cation transporter/ATPase, N-terminus
MLTSVDKGLSPTDFELRQSHFGTNFKASPKMTPYYKLFLGALDDFMLKFLLVCALIDLSIEVGFAENDERSTGKSTYTPTVPSY